MFTSTKNRRLRRTVFGWSGKEWVQSTRKVYTLIRQSYQGTSSLTTRCSLISESSSKSLGLQKWLLSNLFRTMDSAPKAFLRPSLNHPTDIMGTDRRPTWYGTACLLNGERLILAAGASVAPLFHPGRHRFWHCVRPNRPCS